MKACDCPLIDHCTRVQKKGNVEFLNPCFARCEHSVLFDLFRILDMGITSDAIENSSHTTPLFQPPTLELAGLSVPISTTTRHARSATGNPTTRCVLTGLSSVMNALLDVSNRYNRGYLDCDYLLLRNPPSGDPNLPEPQHLCLHRGREPSLHKLEEVHE